MTDLKRVVNGRLPQAANCVPPRELKALDTPLRILQRTENEVKMDLKSEILSDHNYFKFNVKEFTIKENIIETPKWVIN